MTEKNSFGPKCHGCVFFYSESGEVGSHARASLYYMVEHWERHLYGGCQESGDSRGRSAAVKMIMASQITGPHLSSSNSMSNHTTLRLEQPTPSSSRVSVELTRRNCPAYRAGKARAVYSLRLGDQGGEENERT